MGMGSTRKKWPSQKFHLAKSVENENTLLNLEEITELQNKYQKEKINCERHGKEMSICTVTLIYQSINQGAVEKGFSCSLNVGQIF